MASTAVTEAVVEQPYSYDVNAAGNPAPVYSLSEFPEGMNIDAATGLITWTPDSDDANESPVAVSVVATNDEGSATQDFVIVVGYTVTVAPTAGGTTDKDGENFVGAGDTLTITATADDCYTFTEWSVGASGTDNPLSVTVTGTMNITANFAINDADGDGVCDNIDNCPDTANADQADADSDGIGDACDTCANDANNDADGDGVCGDVDNCAATANANQADADSDGIGDACDTCANDANNDADGDGVCGDVDNCAATANANQADADSDGIGDACDTCANDANNDADGDGVCGDVDNCAATANADQADADGDGIGNVCDACPNDGDNDADSDGICGDVDNCPTTANADQADADGDGAGDACDALTLIVEAVTGTLDFDIVDPDDPQFDVEGKPENLIYDLVEAEIDISGTGGNVAVFRIRLPNAAPSGYKWFKFTRNSQWVDFSRDVISGGTGDGAEFDASRTVVTLYITDDSIYDHDLTAGIVKDPSGLGTAAAVPVPSQPSSSSGGGGGGGGCFIGVAQDASPGMTVIPVAAMLALLLAGAIVKVRRTE
jgi:hypothetical protein